MYPLNLSQQISAMSCLATLDVAAYLPGARVYHAACENDRIWLAELTRLIGGNLPPLGHNLFVSGNGVIFRQLQVIDRQEGCILTETPGLGWALAVYDERDLQLFLGKSEDSQEAVRFSLQRMPVRGFLSAATFYGLPAVRT